MIKFYEKVLKVMAQKCPEFEWETIMKLFPKLPKFGQKWSKLKSLGNLYTSKDISNLSLMFYGHQRSRKGYSRYFLFVLKFKVLAWSIKHGTSFNLENQNLFMFTPILPENFPTTKFLKRVY